MTTMLDEGLSEHVTTELLCFEAVESGDAIEPLQGLLHLPRGWAVVRRREKRFRGREVTFTLFDPGGRAATAARVYEISARGGLVAEFWIHPGSTTNRIEPEEARGRAVLMILAAHECDRMESARG